MSQYLSKSKSSAMKYSCCSILYSPKIPINVIVRTKCCILSLLILNNEIYSYEVKCKRPPRNEVSVVYVSLRST
jgi:hypothetical protein